MNVSIFECAPDRKTRARGIFGIALAMALMFLPAALGSPAWFVLMATPLLLLAWAAIDWRRARRLWVALDTGRVWIDGTSRAWTRDDVVAVRTGSVAGAQPASTGGALVPVQYFDLELWTTAKAGRSAATATALSRQIEEAPRGERGLEARARLRQQLGIPDQRLVSSQSAVPVLSAASAVASALHVPWFHEGTLGLDVRSGEHVTRALADREPLRPWPFPEHLSDPTRTRVRQSSALDGTRFEWDYSRLPAIIVLSLLTVVLLGMTIVDLIRGAGYSLLAWVLLDGAGVWAVCRVIGEHDTYAVEVQPTEFVVSAGRTLHIARDDLHDVEVRLTQYPAVFLIGRGVTSMLPTETPFAAYWLAHAISRAAREIQAPPSAGK